MNSDAEQSSDKKRNAGFSANLKNYFTEFSENTGIHGMKYLGEQNRTLCEKICWFIALATSLYFCVVLILITYHKWETSPVIVSFATKETPIWQIPFPAVTICPETKSVPKLFNYTDYLYKKLDKHSLSKKEELKFSYVSFLCNYQPEITHNSKDFIDDKELFDFYEQVSPKFFDNISDCFYMGDAYNCSDIFTPVMTDEGLCYSFNLLNRNDILADNVVSYKNYHLQGTNASEWSLENGYVSSAGKNAYPKRALYAGAVFDFELKLRTLEEELDFTCGNSIQGYKIQIHHPGMLPRVKRQHFRIPLNQALIAAIMPSIITTSEAIKAYTPERRQCYFPSERSLKYFKVYTQQNCQIESKTNYTLQKCGCVDFYMPRTKHEKICGAASRPCMKKAEDELLSRGVDDKIGKIKGTKNSTSNKINQKYNCLPECTAMSYIVENSQSEWDWVSKYRYDRNLITYNKSTTHMSYLQVFFKGNQFITSERNELYGPTDFLANFGGLLGLFTGFSMLSSIEILYYLSLRIICNIKLYGAKYWAGDKKN